MVTIDGTLYTWSLKVNQIFYGKENLITFKFSNPVICIEAISTNLYREDVAGYVIQVAQVPMGTVRLEKSYRIYQAQTMMIVLPSISPYQLLFRLAAPIGNSSIKIWEGVPD